MHAVKILRMSKCSSVKAFLLVTLFLTFIRPVLAAQNIKIEIVRLTWAISAGHIASFQAKTILPNGYHAILICRSGESECGGLQSAVLKVSGCDRSHMVLTCTATGLGYFSARRDGNDVLIYAPKGKLAYHIAGSW